MSPPLLSDFVQFLLLLGTTQFTFVNRPATNTVNIYLSSRARLFWYELHVTSFLILASSKKNWNNVLYGAVMKLPPNIASNYIVSHKKKKDEVHHNKASTATWEFPAS
jgi:hypothetical protein